MDLSIPLLSALLGLSLLGGYVGSMMTGGSIIIFSMLTFMNIPVKTMVGTLKFVIMVLTLLSSITFFKAGAVNKPVSQLMIPMAALGSTVGSVVTISLPDRIVNLLVLAFIFLGMLFGLRGTPSQGLRQIAVTRSFFSYAAGIGLGVYIGVLGIASSIVSILLLMILFKLPLLQANGTGKTLIFSTNLVAFAVYSLSGHVDFLVGGMISIPVALGAWLGAKSAIRIGNSGLRWVFIAATLLSSGKIIADLLWEGWSSNPFHL